MDFEAAFDQILTLLSVEPQKVYALLNLCMLGLTNALAACIYVLNLTLPLLVLFFLSHGYHFWLIGVLVPCRYTTFYYRKRKNLVRPHDHFTPD
jgi:hypothetical protein